MWIVDIIYILYILVYIYYKMSNNTSVNECCNTSNVLYEEVSLKEFIETKILALEKATTIAASTMEKRLEGMNELRGQLKDQALTFTTKTEHEILLKKIDEDVGQIREQLSKSRLEYETLFRRIDDDIKQIREFLSKTINKNEYDKMLDDIKVLRESKALLEGKASQQFANVAMIISVIGMLLSVIGFIITVASMFL